MNILQPWNAVFFVGFVVYLTIRGKFARPAQREEKTHRQVDGLEKLLMAMVIPTSALLPVLYLFTPLLSFADYGLPDIVRACGAAVMVLGLWVFWKSHADLGLNWSVTLEVRKDHQLVTHGIYRSIRHPMYLAIFLFSLAQGLMLPNWFAGWCAFSTFTVMYFVRTPREERMMCEIFEDEYRNYMKRTGRLLPRLASKREIS